MIVVAFYTKGSIYENEVKELETTARQFHVAFDSEAIEDKGDWRLNLSYRPTFILKMLDKHKQGVLVLDADARIRQKPNLLINASCDIAFYYWPKYKIACGGTLYFGNTRMAKEILEEWEKREKEQWETTPNDQFTLKEIVLGSSKWALNSARLFLPVSYLRMNLPKEKRGQFDVEPVIEHLIAGAEESMKRMRKLGWKTYYPKAEDGP